MINNRTVEETKQNPTGTTASAPIIIAPRIESVDITIVMGDQRSSCMTFNGGEACVEDPYDEGSDEDEDTDGDDIDVDGVAEVMDECDRSICAKCGYTDCMDHPQSRETHMRVKNSRPPTDVHRSQGTQPKAATSQKSKLAAPEGDAALDGLPEHFKAFIGLLRAAGLDVKVKNYKQKEELGDE